MQNMALQAMADAIKADMDAWVVRAPFVHFVLQLSFWPFWLCVLVCVRVGGHHRVPPYTTHQRLVPLVLSAWRPRHFSGKTAL